ncbi:Yip1 family protein [Vreelandella utahensis]|uniref:Yip1 family protein n=1 Tax=Vreelandella halophila TaxID=86177 RepID=UPI0009859383|nr:Yip1 family protein [Halomonas utahensis]
MILSHAFGMLFRPETEWAAIKQEKPTPMVVYGLYILILALIGPISAYIGTVETGWTIGDRLIKLTPDSAMQLVILTYMAILAGSFALGYGINWMATTFGAETEKNGNNALALVAYSLTPMYIAGLTLLYPDPWGNAMILLAAASYGAWLMWKGVPVVMSMSKEQSMVYCGGILTLALVLLVSTLATTGLLWNFGFGPTFVEAGL